MKKLLSILTITVALMVANAGDLFAQPSPLTSKTATKEMGYTLLNPGEKIVMYKYYHSAHPPKAAEKFPVKYYFVAPGTENLQDLTLTNLKTAFPANHAFHEALDANFKENKELINYDDFHKIYKVNRLYQNSVK